MNPDTFRHLADMVGGFAAVLTTAAFVPQAWHIWKTRQVAGISLGMYAIFTLGVTLWGMYGVMICAWPVIIANAITFVLAVFILAMKLQFD